MNRPDKGTKVVAHRFLGKPHVGVVVDTAEWPHPKEVRREHFAVRYDTPKGERLRLHRLKDITHGDDVIHIDPHRLRGDGEA